MELRDEIVEAQKARVDLLKWKIIMVATLGALALGLTEKTAPTSSDPTNGSPLGHEYLLCLIPLICLYVDILCSHQNLRIMVIGRYFQYAAAKRGYAAPTFEAEYEQFAESARGLTPSLMKLGKERQEKRREVEEPKGHERTFSVFSYEDLAQHLSSAILSLFVFMWGLSLWIAQMPATPTHHCAKDLMFQLEGGGIFFMLAGLGVCPRKITG